MTALPYCIAVLLFGQVADPATRYATADGNPVIEKAMIRLQDEAEIPAMEAGMLTELSLREGDRAKKGEVIARIDPREAEAAVKVTRYAELAAIKRATQTIEIQYAQAAAAVAEAEWKKVLAANKIKKNAVSESDVDRAKLDHRRSELQIEKAGNDQVLAGYDAKTKRAEREAAEMALDWRTIRAPFDGDVVKTFVHQSEWVHPGEPILRLVRFDKLYVEGRLRAKDFDRSEILGKQVSVEVIKARGRKATVSGKIIHVNQLLEGGGSYTVRAEVENELVNGSWLLQPGGLARMTIHLDQESPESRDR